MKTLEEQISEWIFYAQDDLLVAEDSLQSEIYHLSCFHSQQCIEKILKALLLRNKEKIPKIHLLKKLLKQVIKYYSEINEFSQEVIFMDQFYVPSRYPEALVGSLPEGLPGKEDAQKAVEIARKIFEKGKEILEKQQS